ncbi:hypothetical protein A2W24_04510 [Microgenomates group bacterium RBG_16_45_19]|nr:MAG: hypothetical protein A2W24_04510 [Microgenomates group bacterium RBG_16_45_19]
MDLSNLFLFTRADSFGSILIRGLIWIVLVLIIAAGIDNGKEYLHLKSDMGWFLLVVFSLGLLSIFLFGFLPTF